MSEAEWKAAQMKLVVALRRNLQRSMAELAAIDMDEAQVTLADLGHFIDSQKTDGA